jgi:hypothetical protein
MILPGVSGLPLDEAPGGGMEPELKSIGLGVLAAPSLGLASSDLPAPVISGVKLLGTAAVPGLAPAASERLGRREPGPDVVAGLAAVESRERAARAGGAVGFTSGLGRTLLARASAVVERFFRGSGPGLAWPMSASGLAVGVVLWPCGPKCGDVAEPARPPRRLRLPERPGAPPWGLAAGGSIMRSLADGGCGRSAGDVSGEKKSAVVLAPVEKTLAGVIAGDSSGVNDPFICA